MRLVWGFVLAFILVCAGARFGASEASADGPVTIGYSEVGAHQFTVPAGINSIHVVAVGAPGGSAGPIAGGAGAIATADIAVSPGQTLGVYVGGTGGAVSFSALGGFNGGGDSTEGAGGGGASDVRSGGSGDFGSRLIVAGGGGGAAGGGTAGGSAGESGGSKAGKCEGGGAGTASSGGAGGKGGPGGFDGGPGTLGEGGDASTLSGGGGGGGLYGGGAGGGYFDEITTLETYFCGGGGGSSGFGPGTTATSLALAKNLPPSVTISYGGTAGGTTGTPSPTSPTSPPASGGGPPVGGSNNAGKTVKASLSLPAVQHGKGVVATVQVPASRSALKANLLWQKTKGSKQLVFGKLTEAPLKKGLHSFTVKLNGSGKGELAKLGALKLILAVAVTPPEGPVAKATKRVMLTP